MHKRLGLIMVAAVIGLAGFAGPRMASAHADPSDCDSNGVGLSVTVFRADGTTNVGGGTVQSGETIKYRATLSHLGGTNCNFEGGALTITTPDGVPHVIIPVVPLVTLGSPAVSPLQPYVVSESNVVAGILHANANYSGGTSHTGDIHDSASANVDKNTPYTDTALEVSKTANPAETQDYTWTIDKSVIPTTWDLFNGDSGTSQYTIALVKTLGAATQSVSGNITIHNPSLFATAHVTAVDDAISGLGAVTVNCPGGLPQDIAAGATLVCTYSSSLPDTTTRTNTATVTTTGDVGGGSGEAAIDFSQVEPTITHGSVNVDDSFNAGDGGPFSDSTTYTYNRTYACGSGQGEYSGLNNHVVNTATIVETDQSDSAEVVVNCYALHVGKTAETTFDRQYHWNVDKSADQTEITLANGESFDIHYTVTATMTGSTDSNWNVTGTITIDNPNPTRAADLTNVVDMLTGALSATVNCPDTHVAAGDSLVCTYSRSLPDGTSRTNTATATQQNYNYDKDGVATLAGTTDYSGTAPVTFGAPSTLIDEEVTVTDSFAGALGTVTVAESPKAFHYTRTVLFEGAEACGDHNVDNTATLTTNDTQTVDTDDWRVLVHVNCQVGCTLTQGYWKTHNASFHGGAPTDDNWNLITPLAELSGFFTTANSYPVVGPNLIGTPFTWFSVFWTAPKGNPYYNLAHQYEAAKLNMLNGASSTPAVDSAISYAETLFATYGPSTNWTKAQKAAMTSNAGTLGSYNEGLIGPGHCDQQVPAGV